MSSGLFCCERAMDCRGFVPGGASCGGRRAGPANDIRDLDDVEGFLIVDGIGKFERAWWESCSIERRPESIA